MSFHRLISVSPTVLFVVLVMVFHEARAKVCPEPPEVKKGEALVMCELPEALFDSDGLLLKRFSSAGENEHEEMVAKCKTYRSVYCRPGDFDLGISRPDINGPKQRCFTARLPEAERYRNSTFKCQLFPVEDDSHISCELHFGKAEDSTSSEGATKPAPAAEQLDPHDLPEKTPINVAAGERASNASLLHAVLVLQGILMILIVMIAFFLLFLWRHKYIVKILKKSETRPEKEPMNGDSC